MKKGFKITGIVVMAFLFVCCGYYFNRFSFSKDLYKKGFFTQDKRKTADSVLKIGIIGDSWVEYGGLDTIIHKRLSGYKIDNLVFASGAEGATTKDIYENMYNPYDKIHSSKSVIDRHPKYCVVISGVNDSNRQMGKEYYSYHLLLIVETLMKENIIPVVFSIADYGIEHEYNHFGKLKQFRFKSFALINNDGKINNIQDYNDYFQQELNKKPYKDSVIYISMKQIVKSYNEDQPLFDNYMHLNSKGKKKLGEFIAEYIKDKKK